MLLSPLALYTKSTTPRYSFIPHIIYAPSTRAQSLYRMYSGFIKQNITSVGSCIEEPTGASMQHFQHSPMRPSAATQAAGKAITHGVDHPLIPNFHSVSLFVVLLSRARSRRSNKPPLLIPTIPCRAVPFFRCCPLPTVKPFRKMHQATDNGHP